MPQIWPYDTIRELLTLAETAGHSSAVLSSEEDAKLFRYAIYNFRKDRREEAVINDWDEYLGQDVEITIEGASVMLKLKEIPHVVINRRGG